MTSESAISETRARLHSGECLTQADLDLMLEDFLSPQDISLIEQHLSSCEACRTKFEQIYGSSAWWTPVRNYLDTKLNASSPDENLPDLHAQLLCMLSPSSNSSMIGRIGPYEVSGVVGHGGMGAVFKAFDASLNRYVAIKMLLPHLSNSGAARKRFAREAQAAAAVVNDNVLPIYGVDQSDGSPYIVMQYSRGKSLHKRVQEQGPLELAEVLRIGIQIARGLTAAHAQGLVHRDVKPANILLDGSVERVKLTDFGLARTVDDATLTRSGTITGTPQYMSPEQARGEPIDFQSDLFSMGSVLYTLCTGRPPFRAENSFGILRQITDEEPTPIRDINLNIPDWMCAIVQRLMKKHPQQRYESAEYAATLMEQALAHVQSPQIVPLPEQLRIPVKKKSVLRWSSVALALTAIMLLIGFWQVQRTGLKKSEEMAVAPNSDTTDVKSEPSQSKTQSETATDPSNVVAKKVPDDWYRPDPYPDRTWYRYPDRMFLDLADYPVVQRELQLNTWQIEQIQKLSIDKLPRDSNATELSHRPNIIDNAMDQMRGLLTPAQDERLRQLVFQRQGLYAFNFLTRQLSISGPQSTLVDNAINRNPARRELLRKSLDRVFESTFAKGDPDTASLVRLLDAAKTYHQGVDDSRRQAWNDVYQYLTEPQIVEIQNRRGPPPRIVHTSKTISDRPVDAAQEPYLVDVDMSKVPSKWLLKDPYAGLPHFEHDPDFLATGQMLLTGGFVDQELKLSAEQLELLRPISKTERPRMSYRQPPSERTALTDMELNEILTPDQQTRLHQLAVRHFDLYAIRDYLIPLKIHLTADQQKQFNVNDYFEHEKFVRSQFYDFLQAEIEGKDSDKIDREKILAKKRELDAGIDDAHRRMWGKICLTLTPQQRRDFEKIIGPEPGAKATKPLGIFVPEDWCRPDPYPQRPLYDQRRTYLDLATFPDARQELNLTESQIDQIQALQFEHLVKAKVDRNISTDIDNAISSLDTILTPDQSERLHQLVIQRMGLSGFLHVYPQLDLSMLQTSSIMKVPERDRLRRAELIKQLSETLKAAFANGTPDTDALIKLFEAIKSYQQQAYAVQKQSWHEIYQLLTEVQRADYDKLRGPVPKNARADYDSLLFSASERTSEIPLFDTDLSQIPPRALVYDPYPQLPLIRQDTTMIVTRLRLAVSGLADAELQLSSEQRDAIQALDVVSLPDLESKDLPGGWIAADSKLMEIVDQTQNERLNQLVLRHFDLFGIHNWRVIYPAKLSFNRDQEQTMNICIADYRKFERQIEYQLLNALQAEIEGKDRVSIDRESILAKKKLLDDRLLDAHRRTWGKIYLAMTIDQRRAFETAVGPDVGQNR